MPLFALPAIIPAAIGAAGSIGGALLSRPSSQQKNAMQSAADLNAQQAQNVAQGRDLATQYTGMATPAIQNALNYWNTLLHGDRTAMSTALAPEVSQIGQGIASATDTTSQFAPRGGARTTTLANLPYNQQGQVSSLYQTLRPAAATAVGQLGTQAASLGSGFLSGSTAAANDAASNYLNMVGVLEGLRQNQQRTAANIGSGLYTWAKGIDWSKIFGGSGSTTNAGSGGSFPGLPGAPEFP